MGRKKNKTQNTNKACVSNASAVNVRKPSLSPLQRTELKSLVLRLLEVGYQSTCNSKEEWDQYIDMQTMLKRVIELEAPIYKFYSDPTATSETEPSSSETRSTKIEAFTTWVEENGVRIDGVKIVEYPGYQLGLQATRDLAKDEEVLVVPRKMIFSEEQLNVGASNQSNNFGPMTNINLAYALILEKVKPDSFWKPYLDVLPTRYNTVLYYSVDQMESLRGSTAFLNALRQCRVIGRQYAYLYKCAYLTPELGRFTTMGYTFKEQFCFNLYRWAVSTVMTRENLVPRELPLPKHLEPLHLQHSLLAALIPFWDMANHKPGVISSFYNAVTHEMQCSAQEPIKAGEQFFIYYGDRANADLLVHNGFIDPNNRKDCVSIKLGLNVSDPLYEARTALLSRLNILRTTEFEVLPAPDYISGKLLAFVRIFNMTAEQLAHWSEPSAAERATDLLHKDCALETDHESRTWQYLHTRLMLLLRVFPPTLEADEQALAAHLDGTKPLGEVDASLLHYRVLEKRMLSGALEYAKEHCKA